MQWFRLYNDLRHDPKVQNLRPELFRFWINLLCMASDQKARGVIPSLDAIATDLGMRRDHVERFMAALEASNLVIRKPLDPSNERLMGALDAFEIHGWSTRQPKSDDVAKRVKDYRDKRSARTVTKEGSDEKRYTETPCNVLDTEEDTETDHLPQKKDDEGDSPARDVVPRPDAVPAAEPAPESEAGASLAVVRPEPQEDDEGRHDASHSGPPRPAAPDPAPAPPAAVDGPPAILSLPKQPDPAVVRELEDLSRLVLGDRGEWCVFYTHIRGWLVSYPADWVRDVIYLLGANADVKPNGMARYAFRCLQNWHPHGPKGEDAEKIARARGQHGPGSTPPERHKPMTERDVADVEFVYEAARRAAEERDRLRQARRVAK